MASITGNLFHSNTRLPSIIAAFSTALPPPTSLITSPDDPPLWTLDALFLLPKLRLKYYKKLYSRLLKSTVPGRSDHRLLVGALDKLDGLLDTLEQRAQIRSPQHSPRLTSPLYCKARTKWYLTFEHKGKARHTHRRQVHQFRVMLMQRRTVQVVRPEEAAC